MDIVSDFTGPADTASPQPDAQDPLAAMPDRPKLVLRAIVGGQIPGAYVPLDAPPGEAGGITPDDLLNAGVAIYRPKDTPDVTAVMFDPKQLNDKEMAHLDQAGKIMSTFPNVVDLIGGPQGAQGSPAPTDMSAPVPVQAAPMTSGAPLSPASQASINTHRITALQGQAPSERPLPGRGSVLNGLVTPAA